MLIILAGLPGAGKTTLARELARRLGAAHIRIDSIEQSIRDAGSVTGPMDDTGYRVGYAIAEDNLRLGRMVIADSVNPLDVTRDAWLAVARRAKVRFIEVEVTCCDPVEHRRRVETRSPDIATLRLPGWEEVVAREYHPWTRERLVIDTAALSVHQAVEHIRRTMELP